MISWKQPKNTSIFFSKFSTKKKKKKQQQQQIIGIIFCTYIQFLLWHYNTKILLDNNKKIEFLIVQQ